MSVCSEWKLPELPATAKTNNETAAMKKIAVVEDNPDNRLLVRVILESLY